MPIYDAEASVMLAPTGGAAIIADTTYPVITANAHLWPTAAWVINVSAINSTGAYTFLLEIADAQAGPFSTIARVDWPAGATGSKQVAAGASASAARIAAASARVRFCRVRALVGGATPSVAFSSWLSKPGGAVGIAKGTTPADALVNAP